jgi:hypothetical protein
MGGKKKTGRNAVFAIFPTSILPTALMIKNINLILKLAFTGALTKVL